MEINLINTKFKKFTNSVYVETILEHKIKSAVVEKFNIQPKLLIKLEQGKDIKYLIFINIHIKQKIILLNQLKK